MAPVQASWWLLSVITAAWLVVIQPSLAAPRAEGAGIYLMEPGLPSVFTFDRDTMSCSVSWGTMGAPGPGPLYKARNGPRPGELWNDRVQLIGG